MLFYTWPLKYIGLGELAVILVWGPLMIGGGYYVHHRAVETGTWCWPACPTRWASTTRDLRQAHRQADPRQGQRHPHPAGDHRRENGARTCALGMMALQYLLVIYLVITGFFTPVMLVVAAR